MAPRHTFMWGGVVTEPEQQAILRALGDFRVEVAASHAEFRTRLNSMADHDNRLRRIERESLTRQDIETIVARAIEGARRPSWRDVGAVIASIGASVTVTAVVLRMANHLGG
jgi:hypothetical protein